MDRESDRALAEIRLARLRARAHGVAGGLLVGLGVFCATNWLVLKGGPGVGAHLRLLSQYFIGYEVSFLGSLIGAAYGGLIGFIAGYLFARTYNLFASLKEKKSR
jgi:hypothetical protein